MKIAIVGLPKHSASPPKKPFASHYRSPAPSPSCKPRRPPVQDSLWDDCSRILEPLPDKWGRHTKGFATLAGALALNETELRALQPVPRESEHSEGADADADERERGRGERGRERDRPATRSQAALGQKVEFSLRGARKPYLRKYGVPLYALLGATEDELRKHVVGGSARSVAGVNLRRIRIRLVWPQPRTVSAPAAVYEEWVRIDESTTKVQLAMLVAKVFNRFLEQKTAELSRDQTFDWRLRPDALYRTWLVRLERVETNVFVADLRYALHDP